MYDLIVSQRPFSQAWESAKTKKEFKWQDGKTSVNNKDAYAVKDYSAGLSNVFSETTREKDKKKVTNKLEDDDKEVKLKQAVKEESKNESKKEDDFQFGLDHGFDSYATHNG